MLSLFKVLRTFVKGKRYRELESVQFSQMENERKSFHEFLEKESDRALQGEFAAQTRLSEAQAELDRREWERRNADIALFGTGSTSHSISSVHRSAHMVRLTILWSQLALSGSAPLGGTPPPRRRLFVETLAPCGSPLSSAPLITEVLAGLLGQPPSERTGGECRDVPSTSDWKTVQLGKRPERCAGSFTRPKGEVSKR